MKIKPNLEITKQKGGQPSNFTLTSVIKSADVAVEDLANQTAKGNFLVERT